MENDGKHIGKNVSFVTILTRFDIIKKLHYIYLYQFQTYIRPKINETESGKRTRRTRRSRKRYLEFYLEIYFYTGGPKSTKNRKRKSTNGFRGGAKLRKKSTGWGVRGPKIKILEKKT